ncbi:Uncharacterised protein [Serratia fonticola]|uniref:O-antigen ligase family protein n=1 Tax=Serratia fonticola TaxID=47917 RepID=UPI0021771AD4|nr:O-antigen ligase family protein [Serratia fonticola]CAI0964222.1 Uncharacterised protein [Serratia fonticola]
MIVKNNNKIFRNFILSLPILFGILSNTAIVNFNTVGIPLFILIFPLVFLITGIDKILISKIEMFSLVLILFLFLCVSLGHVISIFKNVNTSELTQFCARISFLLSFYVMLHYYRYLKIVNKENIFFCSVKTYLLIAIFYGLYQMVAQRLGYPLFLDWVANNKSFTVGAIGGWLGADMLRVRSFWSEPSMSAFPVAFITYLIIRSTSTVKMIFLLMIISIYTFLTFSRTVITAYIFVIILSFFVFTLRKFIRSERVKNAICKFILLAIIFFGFIWPYFVVNFFDDLSSIGRSSSVIVGMRIWIDNFLVGSGYNSFSEVQFQYLTGLKYYHEESIVHNSFVSILQQAGILGFIAIFYPLLKVVKDSRSAFYIVSPIIIPIILIFTTGGGLDYFSYYWTLTPALIVFDSFKSRRAT